MADDELKRLLEEQAAAILEHVDRRFDAVDGRFESVDRRFEAIDHRFETIDEQFADMRRHFDVVGEQQEVRFAAVNEAITSLDERTQRGFAGLEQKIANESSETRSMLRLSYTELDRRLRSLEERVERLEQTIH